MTHRFWPALVAGLLLSSCAGGMPRAPAEFATSARGVAVRWQLTAPGALAPAVGYATWFPGDRVCVVQLDGGHLATAGDDSVRAAAHEFGHCLMAAHSLPGLNRPDLGSSFGTPREGYAETYARAYLDQCGLSLAPLGWPDPRPPDCDQAPDPLTLSP